MMLTPGNLGAVWPGVGYAGHLAAAAALMLVSVWLLRRWERHWPARPALGDVALMIALLATSLWAFVAGLAGGTAPGAALAESLRNLAWLGFLFQLVRTARRPASVLAIYAVLAAILLIQPVIDLGHLALPAYPEVIRLLSATAMLMRMIFAVGALVLAHNLYLVAADQTREGLRYPLTALAALWLYDLNLYTVGYLGDVLPVDLVALRGVLVLMLVPFFALAARRKGGWKLMLSRKIAYRSLSLVAILGYLALMIATAELLRASGGEVARVAQTMLVVGMSVAAMLLLPSKRFRAWFKVKANKHFFAHRYDYRQEWMRFTATIGHPGDGAASFNQRVIQALADIADSPAGLLLTPNDQGRLALQARFNWATAAVPATACTASTIGYFQDTGRIVELDSVRRGDDQDTLAAALPEWLIEEQAAWTIVPLVHFDRLAGLVVLARPIVSRTLDWEDFDLLRVASRQVASYLAEARAQEALLESEQFDEFNRRFAFVMHDIKNLVSQLSLVARNAERHADNPAFRADMIETLKDSVGKMNTLIARLTRYARAGSEPIVPVDVERILRQVVAEKARRHDVQLQPSPRLVLLADAAQLEQVVAHLVQNAIDASPDGQTVFVKLYRDGLAGCIDIVDHGMGMSAEFVRSKLFKPFLSSKPDGFGIGAFEARSLIEAMQGRIEVESREGEGSRFTLRLPLATQIDETGRPAPAPHATADTRHARIS